jgi:hypothetical protein
VGTPAMPEEERHAHRRTAILISALAAGLLGGALAATFIVMRRRRHLMEPTERAERLVHACYELSERIDHRLKALGVHLPDAPQPAPQQPPP